MALQFITGFDYYDTPQVNRVWPYSSGGTSIAPGRFGGRAWGWNNANGFLSTVLNPSTTIILGMAFFLSYGDATSPILLFQDGTTSQTNPVTQVDLRVTADAGWQFTRNGTVISTSLPGTFSFGFWNYLEVLVTISDTLGVVQLRINGQTFLNSAALDTKFSGNNYINMVRLQPFAPTGNFNYKVDDLYICDDTGSTNNTFRGECRVQTQYPSSNGERNDFAPINASTNWQAVDDTTPDDDGTYVRSGVVGNIDDYHMGTVSFTGTIYGVQVNVMHRKDDVGTRTITPLMHSFSNYFEGALFNCMSDYTLAHKLWELEPQNNATWTNTAVNQITAGLKIKA